MSDGEKPQRPQEELLEEDDDDDCTGPSLSMPVSSLPVSPAVSWTPPDATNHHHHQQQQQQQQEHQQTPSPAKFISTSSSSLVGSSSDSNNSEKTAKNFHEAYSLDSIDLQAENNIHGEPRGELLLVHPQRENQEPEQVLQQQCPNDGPLTPKHQQQQQQQQQQDNIRSSCTDRPVQILEQNDLEIAESIISTQNDLEMAERWPSAHPLISNTNNHNHNQNNHLHAATTNEGGPACEPSIANEDLLTLHSATNNNRNNDTTNSNNNNNNNNEHYHDDDDDDDDDDPVPTITELVARTTTASSLTAISYCGFITTSSRNHGETAASSSSSSCQVVRDGDSSIITIATVESKNDSIAREGGSDISHDSGENDKGGTGKAACEFNPPVHYDDGDGDGDADAGETRHRTGVDSNNLLDMEDMILAKRRVSRGIGRIVTADGDSDDDMLNHEKTRYLHNQNTLSDANCTNHKNMNNDNNGKMALPVVQEQSILDELGSSNVSQSSPSTPENPLHAARRRRATMVRPGAYHQAPGQVAVRRARARTDSLHVSTPQRQSRVGNRRSSRNNGSSCDGSVASTTSGWHNLSAESSCDSSIISMSSFSLQENQERHDHLPPDIMMMDVVNDDDDEDDDTLALSSCIISHRHSYSGHVSGYSVQSFDTHLYGEDEESVLGGSITSFSGSLALSQPTGPHGSGSTIPSAPSSALSRSRTSFSSHASLATGTSSATPLPLSTTPLSIQQSATVHDSANSVLVHAHPVPPQDTSNIVAADPVDGSERLPQRRNSSTSNNQRQKSFLGSRTFILAIVACTLLSLGGIIAVVSRVVKGNGWDNAPPSLSPFVPTTERGILILQQLEAELGPLFDSDSIIDEDPDKVVPEATTKTKTPSNKSSRNISLWRAFGWLVDEDPLQLDHTAGNLLQRYLLAFFYFHTSQNGRWVSCNPAEGSESMFCTYYYVNPFNEKYQETPWSIRWLSSEHECKWAGIFCDNHNSVYELSLNGYNLSGPFPTEIAKLSELRILSLRENKMSGQLPSELSDISNLEVLRLNQNLFTGKIPYHWGVLTSLKTLDVARNYLTGALSTGLFSRSMSSLENLWIYQNQFSGSLPSDVSSLTRLKQIFMHNNNFVGPIPNIGVLTHLEYLDASSNEQIAGTMPSEVGLLTNLRDLVLSSTALEGTIPGELYSLSQLQHLKLNGCRFTGSLSTRIGQMTGLQTLMLQGNRFSGELPSELGSLKSLINVQIQNNDFVGIVPDALCVLKGPNTLVELVADCVAPPMSDANSTIIGQGQTTPKQEEPLAPLECKAGCCTTCCDPDTKVCVPNS